MPWIRRHPETEIQAATLLTTVLTAHPLRSDGTYDLAVSLSPSYMHMHTA